MDRLLVLWRRHLPEFFTILALVSIVGAVVFRHPLFWRGMTMLKDPQQTMMLLEWAYLPSLFALFGGLQVIFIGFLLLWLLFHTFHKQFSRG